jgi:hypothetical protein
MPFDTVNLYIMVGEPCIDFIMFCLVFSPETLVFFSQPDAPHRPGQYYKQYDYCGCYDYDQ